LPDNSLEILVIELKDTISQLNKKIDDLTKSEAQKDAQNQNLIEQISILTKVIADKDDIISKFQQMLFGSQSEKKKRAKKSTDEPSKPEDVEKPSEIPEELFDPEDAKEPKTKKPKPSFAEKYANLPSETVRVDNLTEEEKICGECGTKMVPIGTELLRSEIIYQKAELKVINYVGVTYGCPKCKEEGERPVFVKNKNCPSALLAPSFVSESLAAHCFYDKFNLALPFYRQESDYKQFGISISRSTMASWAIKCHRQYLKPVVEFFRRLLIKRRFITMDETTWQVLNEPDRNPENKSYIWLARSGEDGMEPIVIYFYDPSRNGDVATDILEGIEPGYYLMVDGYQGYNKLKGAKRCVCFAHLRRKFLEAIPKGKDEDLSLPSVQGFNYCEKIFRFERRYREKGYSFEQRYKHRLKDEKPILEAFLAWIDKQQPTGRDSWNKALTYAKNRKPDIMTYLEDGRCSATNNASENSIRPVTVLRKNSLFSDSQAGAHASMAILTIFEMAKLHKLNQYEYMKYILESRPYEGMPDQELEKLVPWNEEVKKVCAIKGSEK